MNLTIRITLVVIIVILIGAVVKLTLDLSHLRDAQTDTPVVSRETGQQTIAVNTATNADTSGATTALQAMEQFYASRQGTQPEVEIANDDLRNELANRRKKERFLEQFEPNCMPVGRDFYITQRFGEDHQATDYAAPLGDDIFAVASGAVAYIGEDEFLGRLLVVDHLNGYATLYAHVENYYVASGAFVEKGQPIATVGNTGRSTAPHLHLEIWRDGVRLDPEKFIGRK